MEDPLVIRLIAARKRDAVIKHKIAAIRSASPDAAIFAFEGDDDKIAYNQWINRINSNLRYESFTCGGKKEVCRLKDIANRDVNDMREFVYFFADRDFDDLAGFSDSYHVFMTDQYSIENYLVTRTIIEKCLEIDFPCDGHPQVRRKIGALFDAVYEQFLLQTKNINMAIFTIRKLGIDYKPTHRIGDLSKLTLTCAAPPVRCLEITCLNDVDTDPLVLLSLSREFATLNPRTRYRGKFAMLFLRRWLDLLVSEYNTDNEEWFSERRENSCPRSSEFTLGVFASRSDFPEGLAEFLSSISHQSEV